MLDEQVVHGGTCVREGSVMYWAGNTHAIYSPPFFNKAPKILTDPMEESFGKNVGVQKSKTNSTQTDETDWCMVNLYLAAAIPHRCLA